MSTDDRLVLDLRAAGCVFAEEEAGEIRRVLDDPVEIAAAVAARAQGRPLEQVLGRARYLGVEVAVDGGVFVPRHRTSALVRAAATGVPPGSVVVDLGCGSGAIAAALCDRLTRARVHACDVDPVALRCARRNAETYGFTVHEGEWWRALPDKMRGTVDVAVAYLPHVPTGKLDHIARDFRTHEPTRSVDGGANGLAHLRSVLSGLHDWLADGGVFWTMLAVEQADAAREIARTHRVTAEPYEAEDAAPEDAEPEDAEGEEDVVLAFRPR